MLDYQGNVYQLASRVIPGGGVRQSMNHNVLWRDRSPVAWFGMCGGRWEYQGILSLEEIAFLQIIRWIRSQPGTFEAFRRFRMLSHDWPWFRMLTEYPESFSHMCRMLFFSHGRMLVLNDEPAPFNQNSLCVWRLTGSALPDDQVGH